MPIPSLARFLDPRPTADSLANPISQAVAIPLSELPGRMHELPPRHGRIEVAGPEPHASAAVDWLRESGREAEVSTEWKYGPSTPGRLWKPNRFLEDVECDLTPGRALDLACGTGRDAVFLAGLGWEVVAIDHLKDALDRGSDLAGRYLSQSEAASIEWLALDLEKSDVVAGIPYGFDLISVFWFLNRNLIRNLPRLLRPGGHLIIETFTATHRQSLGKPRTESFVLKPGEPADLLPNLREVITCEGWHEGRHSMRYQGRSAEPTPE